MRTRLAKLFEYSWLLLLAAAALSAEEARLYLQTGHSGNVTSVAFSPDGRYLLTGGSDQTARLWEAASGAEIRQFRGHSNEVMAVAFSPDGRFVLTGSRDQTARLWDAHSGTEIRRFQGHSDAVCAAAYSPDGRYVLTGSWDDTALLWDASSGARIRQFSTRAPCSVAFSPDTRFILTGGWDGVARLWDAASGAEIRHFGTGADAACSVAFSPDGRFLVTANEDHGPDAREDTTARLWDAASGAEVRRFQGHTRSVTALAFSPDGRFLLTASRDGTARLWDVASGAGLRQFGSHSTDVLAAAFSPDGRFVLTGEYGTALLWDAASGAELRQFRGYSGEVWSVAWARGGLLVTAGTDEALHLWDLAGGSEIRRIRHLGSVQSVALSPNGRMAITGNIYRNLYPQLWDTASGTETHKLLGHSSSVVDVAFSPDGRFALTGSWDKTARLWDAATGAEIRQFLGHSDMVESVAFSPDGRFVLTGSEDKTARLWDVASGAEVRRFQGHSGGVDSVAFSPDGRFVLTRSWDYTARLWNAASGAELRQFGTVLSVAPAPKRGAPDYPAFQDQPPGAVTSAAFSPDGRFVLTASADGTMRLLDAATGAEIRRFQGHSQAVGSVAFSPDGSFVLGSSSGAVQLWDTVTGKWLATLVSFSEGGWAVVDPQGRYDASDPDSAPGLHFVAGNDVIELRQLKRRFYTPGLLARIWRGEKPDPIAASLKDVRLAPAVELIPPGKDSTQATIRLTNRAGGLGEILVKVNGREVPTATRGSSAWKPDDASAELRLDLSSATLSPAGNNVIEVSAFNGENSIASRGVIAAWTRTPAEDPNPPRVFAIVVGTSRYANERMNLRYSAKDATDIGNALRLAATGLYDDASRVNVTVLASGTSLEPTKENIRSAFDAVARQARAQDLLIVYFAGHGEAAHTERDQYYYFTSDARSADVETDSALRGATTVSSSELRDWLYRRNMPLKQVLVLDTCAAGAAFNDVVSLAGRRDLSPDQIRAIQFLKDSTGSWILMGSAADAVSYEANRYAQGLLTYALLEGMKGAALDGDRVEVSRLFAFAQRQVEDLALGIGGIQRPILSAPKGQTFPIGILKEQDRERIHLAQPKPELLRARVHDEDDLDPLKLEPALRAELRAASLPATRGAGQSEPAVVYLDQVVDELPDALIPVLRYTVAGERVKIRLRLLRNGKPVTERNLDLPGTDPAELANRLVADVVAESEQAK